jgi:adenine phosphoribosyltransferase
MAFDYEHLIADIPDYPTPGVVFKDITPLLGDPEGLRALVDDIVDHFADAGVTKVMGAESRGFMVGAPVACKLGAGFVPARKPGKLPREVITQEYALEYGADALQMHADAIGSDDAVLLVDDLLATGGTAAAMYKLARQTGAKVVGYGFLMELEFLNPRKVLSEVSTIEVYSLVKVR